MYRKKKWAPGKSAAGLYKPACCVNHFGLVRPKYAARILWSIFTISILATLVSCVSQSQTAYVLRSKKMDKQANAICDRYDAEFIGSVLTNWWTLLDSKRSAYDRGRGKVILKFCLHSNGQVTDMNIAERTVPMGDAGLCEKAVLNGVPYPSWSEEILKALGTNSCDVKFTFDYY
jgi:hypothetical protein